MTREELRAVVVAALGQVAPEVEADTLDAKASLREQCDLDSVDFLNFVVALHAATGVEIPDTDNAKLSSVEACVEYLARALEARGA